MASTTATSTTGRPPPWRDVRVLRIAAQVVVVVAVVALVAYLYDNLTANQRALNIDTSFDFLDQQAGFAIAYSDFSPSGTVWEALLVGLRNTLTVALVGIVLTLVLGTLVGIARLSGNWLVRRVAGAYVESVRNVPPLLVIIFVNSAALATLPPIEDARRVGGGLLLSVRQIGVMVPRGDGHGGAYLALLAVAVLAAVAVARWREGVEARAGRPARRWAWGLAVFGVPAVAGWFALDAPIVLSRPEVVGLSIEGGTVMGLPYVAVLVGLVLYTATHVAEIVRGSILAVPAGQGEAATALGLSTSQRLRHVVLPQAFRIAVPPTINQCLNLTKNTSLGVAVAYAEAMYVANTVIASGGKPAIQTILVVMGMYLVVSLSISLVANVAHRRLRLVER
ncbi:MAG TPA: ABC transporter permease subunit [Acidimicrobiales bacterium]|nr:ABC transporter permease subunit [Acidimicrobiales bacterium]